jgi:hypothetical protein
MPKTDKKKGAAPVKPQVARITGDVLHGYTVHIMEHGEEREEFFPVGQGGSMWRAIDLRNKLNASE